jgi:hypothetical protein
MASVRNQLEELDAKIAQWQQMVEPEEAIDVTSDIDLDFDDDIPVSFDDEPVAEPEQEEPLAEPVSEPLAEPVSEPLAEPEQDEPLAEPVSEPVYEGDPVQEDTPLAEDASETEDSVFELPAGDDKAVDAGQPSEVGDDLPFFDLPPETAAPAQDSAPLLNDVHASEEKSAVIDVMTQHHAWRTAVPGAPVKDIRGAIALMDRVLFINKLFGTDPMAFQDALTRINQMQTLDEAVGYLASAHPEWDFDSDIVYSFMMAVRRKVQA